MNTKFRVESFISTKEFEKFNHAMQFFNQCSKDKLATVMKLILPTKEIYLISNAFGSITCVPINNIYVCPFCFQTSL